MDNQIVAVFCLSDDMLKALHHHEDQQCQMRDSEVMTTAIVAALYHGGNFERARQYLREEGYIPHMLSKSRLICPRRQSQLPLVATWVNYFFGTIIILTVIEV